MTILEQMRGFAGQYQKEATLRGTTWRYYRLGDGPPILWLTGGLRRAALGYAFMERLGEHHTVIAPDYPPVRTIDEFMVVFDAILQQEGISRFVLAGQSYGGMLAQAYLAHKPYAVEKLVLSSTGPADSGKAWLPVVCALITLARILPEKKVVNLMAGVLFKIMSFPESEHDEWTETVRALVQKELSRADVISFFAVAADLIRKGIVKPAAFQVWEGRVVVLSAENDPTQSARDFPRYEKLFGRPVEVIGMGKMGHTAAFFDPDQYVALLEQALT